MKYKRGLFTVLFVVLAIVVYGVLVLTGKVPSPIKGVSNAIQDVSSQSGDALYSELDTLITNPDHTTDLKGKFTFTVYVIGKATEQTFDDEPGVKYLFQESCISRNGDHSFLLDVRKLAKSLETDKFYQVTGTLDGSVYWTEDNKKVSMLDILVSDAKPFTPADIKVNNGPSYTDGSVTYTFKGAYFDRTPFNKAIVVYFDFKNNTADDIAPSMYGLTFYQGDSNTRLSNTIMDVQGKLDSHALNATKAGITDQTYVGKTSLYFAVYQVSDDVKKDANTLYLERYNDDFQCTDSIAIPISKDYSAWAAGR